MTRTLIALTATSLMALTTATAQTTALTGATVLDGTGGPAIEGGTVIVEDGRLACVGAAEACPVPEGATVTDVSGHFITPGLVDAHVHFGQTGWLDGRPDSGVLGDVYAYDETIASAKAHPERWHEAYLCTGITAVYDVGGQAWTVTGEHATDTDRPDRVHVRAAGPLTTHVENNAGFMTGAVADEALFLPMQENADIAGNIAFLQEIGAHAMKVWYLAPSDEDRERLDALMMAAGAAADDAGLPLIVHATSLREAKIALQAGAEMLVHSVDDAPVDAEFLRLLTENDVVYAPTLQAGRNWARALASVAVDSPAPIDDPNNCVDADIRARINDTGSLNANLPPRLDFGWAINRLENAGAEVLQMQQNLVAVHEAGGLIATATDAGNPMTLHGPSIYEEMELMEAAGIDPAEIITLSTRNGAIAMGLEGETGTIEAGKIADLIVLAEDPRESTSAFRSLTHVMRLGVLTPQSALQVHDGE
ncbi:amidohydrolase family protein [Aquisalinus flavus]|uniref:Amidohydrolase-related domain-containing protein n=1 Tax=Aquisalinus flavus TaxID=1526572 RepID=A0A8J2V254_9PROT|nr:amidohydrolase family protein [Aquisalinus flavus]MBD0425475.1 amidohydrolase family protein [Aquisalinus flavus]UNE48891.1 amidohydrolase family protein [Aquisalinus flavus]GGD15765.1 hypothetical protein GCM10011342_25690 [Aquisalinus flavus]